jgi:hypothetical protein
MTRENVIKGLECCSNAVLKCGENCPYWDIENYESIMQDDALALLKAQEPMNVDAVPVVHGRWGENGDCSECGFQPWYEHDIHTLSYCPNCGAKMDGDT